MQVIVAEKRLGAMFCKSADRYDRIEDFIEETAILADFNDGTKITGVDDAVAWLNKFYNQDTHIIYEEDFRNFKYWDVVINEQAEAFGWYEPADF